MTDRQLARARAIQVLIHLGWSPPRPSDEILRRITEDIGRVHVTASLGLMPSERRSLSFAARGFTEREEADAIGLGYETVRTQRKDARRRLGARNMAHAVFLAARRGEISV